MATKKKLLQAAAGTAAASGGAGALNVEDVFSTYLYEGNGGIQRIENGLSLGQSLSSGSALFEGQASGDYLTYPSSSDFSFGTGDFTVEAFVNINTSAGNGFIFQITSDSSYFSSTQANQLGFQHFLGDLYYSYNGGFSLGAASFTVGDWVHVALSRSSGTLKFFVDGTQAASVSDTTNYTGTYLVVGAGYGSQYSTDGYISNLRVVKGSAVYTSAFTPPTSALTAITNTKLLILHGDSPFNDASSSGRTATNNGSVLSATNGPFDAADAGEGGLVWMKSRTNTDSHRLFDTARASFDRYLDTATTNGDNFIGNFGTPSSNGFTMTGSATGWNETGTDYASWTFRKAPKFFDVVTYTGTGSAQNISHNLGAEPAVIIVKRTSSAEDWLVYHRSTGNQAGTGLNETAATYTGVSAYWNSTTPTDSVFTVGTHARVNTSGQTYVAYLFAHNDGDGDFGPTGDQDIIKCGSFTPPSSGEQEVTLGFEPQFIITFDTGGGDNWRMYDTMRGWDVANRQLLNPNQSAAESSLSNTGGYEIKPTATGFIHEGHTASSPHIYIAIRRGPMAVPESATDVFKASLGDSTVPGYDAPFAVDMAFNRYKISTAGNNIYSRLTGPETLDTSSTAAASSDSSGAWDYMDGWYNSGRSSDFISWMWKRAPNFFDVVAYTGNGTAGRSVPHNLGVVPEMMWVKRRDTADSWNVYHTGLDATAPETKYIRLNSTAGVGTNSDRWNDTAPTATGFVVSSDTTTNGSGATYIAYLFASLDGVSKVGSYTGTGSTLNIDCGFSSGARFVLIKRTDSTGDWMLFDTERGIVAGNDPFLMLNETNAENSGQDLVDPYSSGFTLTNSGNGNVNGSGGSYIFYAIA